MRLIHIFVSKAHIAFPACWQFIIFTCDVPFCSVRIISSEIRTCNKERGIDSRFHICRRHVEEFVILILCNHLPLLVLVFRSALGGYCLMIAKFVLVVRISSEIT